MSIKDMNDELLIKNLELRREEVALLDKIEERTNQLNQIIINKENLANEIETLNSLIKEKETMFSSLEDKVFKYSNALDILYMSENYESIYKSKKNELDTITKTYNKYKEELETIKKERTKSTEDLSKLEIEYNNINKELENRKKILENVSKKLEVATTTSREVESKLSKLKTEHDRFTQDLSLLIVEKNSLTSECKDLLRTNKNLKQELETMEEDANSKVENIIASKTEKLELELQTLKEETINNNNLMIEKAKLNAIEIEKNATYKLSLLNNEINIKNEELCKLSNDISKISIEKTTLLNDIATLGDELTSLKMKDLHLKESIEKLNDTLIEQDVRLKAEKLSLDLEDMNKLKDKLIEKNEQLGKVILEKNEEITQLKKDKNNYSHKTLSDENTKNKYMIEQLQSNLKEAHNEITELRNSTTDDELVHEIKRLKKELKCATDNLNTMYKSTSEIVPTTVIDTNKVQVSKFELISLGAAAGIMTGIHALKTISGPSIFDLGIMFCSSAVIVNAVYDAIYTKIKYKMDLKREAILKDDMKNTENLNRDNHLNDLLNTDKIDNSNKVDSTDSIKRMNNSKRIDNIKRIDDIEKNNANNTNANNTSSDNSDIYKSILEAVSVDSPDDLEENTVLNTNEEKESKEDTDNIDEAVIDSLELEDSMADTSLEEKEEEEIKEEKTNNDYVALEDDLGDIKEEDTELDSKDNEDNCFIGNKNIDSILENILHDSDMKIVKKAFSTNQAIQEIDLENEI